MLENNDILGYLPLSVVRKNGEDEIYRYDISDLVPLSEYFLEHAVRASVLRDILKQLEKIFIRGKSFMFEEDDFVISLNYIFIDEEFNLRLCFLPNFCHDIREQIIELIGELLNLVDTEDKNEVFLMYKAYSLAKEERCTFKAIIGCLGEEESADEGEGNPEALAKGITDSKNDSEKGKEEEFGLAVNDKKKIISRKTKETLEYCLLIVVFAAIMMVFILKN